MAVHWTCDACGKVEAGLIDQTYFNWRRPYKWLERNVCDKHSKNGPQGHGPDCVLKEIMTVCSKECAEKINEREGINPGFSVDEPLDLAKIEDRLLELMFQITPPPTSKDVN